VRGVNGLHYLVRMLPYSVTSSSARGAVTSFLDVTALHEISRLQHIIDALAEHIAVLNTQGVITLVNTAWRHFAAANGDPELRYSGIGINYLDVCREVREPNDSSDRTASAAQQGVSDVLEGRRSLFSLEYPCHSPTEERWFVMHVSRVGGEQPGAVVSHVNITEWREQRAGVSA
jgi:two-component system CheB/CheR fusion protein